MYSRDGAAAPAAQQDARALRVTCVGVTHAGLQRLNNEDRHGVVPELGLFLVADGMGGHAAGEVAAQLAIRSVCEALADADGMRRGSGAPQSTRSLELLTAAIEGANDRIHGAAKQTPAWEGMGTTIAALLLRGHRAVVAHVGDSRVHRLRGESLTLLTEDHNVFNELVRMGLANPARPGEHPGAHHVLTRALGTNAKVDVDARVVDVAPGDVFLLSTDGLHGLVDQRALAETLVRHPNIHEAGETLVARANGAGGPDNITAVLVKIE